MPLDQEAVALGHFVLQLLDRLVFELFDVAATGTDQVVVVLPLAHVLVAGLAVAELHLAGDARLGEELQGAVHGGVADVRVLGPELQIQLLDAQMPVAGEETVEDDVALLGRLESALGHEFGESFFLGSFHDDPN